MKNSDRKNKFFVMGVLSRNYYLVCKFLLDIAGLLFNMMHTKLQKFHKKILTQVNESVCSTSDHLLLENSALLAMVAGD